MCTVTFIARKRGYALGMNRDEKLTRAHGLPTTERIVEGRRVIGPAESGGGTWIALNETGVTFALINWYSITARANGVATSRGEIIAALSPLDAASSVAARLQELPLKRINPFRLIGIFPATRQIIEWRWDLNHLTVARHRWETRQWISSGFDEPVAQRIRSQTFRVARHQQSAGSLAWLRRLHRSHAPKSGPFSICMHRADAATVSYTEVSVSSYQATLRYHAGALCQALNQVITTTSMAIERAVTTPASKRPRRAANLHLPRPADM